MRNLILILLLGCAACTTEAQDPANKKPAPAASAAPASDTLGRIRAMVGDAACSDTSQCRSLALGSRSCGGPEAYLAYSTAKTSEVDLRALGERYQKEREAADAASGMMSTCQFIPDPGAVCEAGRCQLGSAAAAAR